MHVHVHVHVHVQAKRGRAIAEALTAAGAATSAQQLRLGAALRLGRSQVHHLPTCPCTCACPCPCPCAWAHTCVCRDGRVRLGRSQLARVIGAADAAELFRLGRGVGPGVVERGPPKSVAAEVPSPPRESRPEPSSYLRPRAEP